MQEAETWTRKDLTAIWAKIKAGEPIENWGPGKAFEYLVIRAFHLEGTQVRWPFQVTYPQKFGTMEQLDGVVYLQGRPFLVESKNLSEPAAIEAVAKLRFRLEGRPPLTMGVLFSVSNFTLPTEVFAQFASPLNVLLWNRSDLDIALPSGEMTEGLRQKFEYAIEYGLPLFPFEGPK
jgi:hypothetical protein